MLNNLTNFFNLLATGRFKKELEDTDVLAVGTQTGRRVGNYKPTGIQVKDLKEQFIQLVGQSGNAPVQELLYKEVEISSAEILAMGTTPVELIPAEQDKVYNINKMIIESNPLTTAYTIASQLFILNGNAGALVSNQIITDNLLNKGMAIVNDMNGFVFNDFNVSEAFFINTPQAVTLTTFTGANPTLGDGSIIVKIWYTVETFGSNL
jgi:hypothetical protein